MRIQQLLPDFVRRSYLRKFAFAVAGVAVLVTVVGILAQSAIAADLTDQRNTEVTTITEQEANGMEQWMGGQRDTVRTLSSHYDVWRGASTGSTLKVTRRLSQEMDGVADSAVAIHYVNVTSTAIEGSTESNAGSRLSDLGVTWQRSALEFGGNQDVIVSEVYRYDGDYRVATVSPVPGSDKAIMLVHSVSDRAETFSTSIEGSETTVVDATGRIQISQNESAISTRFDADGESRAVREGVNESGVYTDDGRLVAYAPVAGTNWIVVKEAPTDAAYQLRSEIQTILFGLIGAAVLGFGVLGGIIGLDLRRSLGRVTANAEALAAGTLDASVEDDDRLDEIGDLQEAFAETRAYLQTVADQADALARQEFDARSLDEDVPGRLGESLDRMQTDLEGFVADIEQARTESEQAREEAEELADTLETQAEAFSRAMERAADGDLTQRLDADLDNEAMAAIAAAFNEMLTELEHTVDRIDEFAADVDDSSDTISASVAEVENASEEVSEAVQEIATGAERQDESVTQAADEMTDLSASIEEVASSATEVANTSREAAEMGEAGSEAAADTVEEMHLIEDTADETAEQMERLDERMADIEEVVGFIDDIADQTSMLALNASIEAARAGEAGQGFAVVADEIKSLAQETASATDEIADMIADVQDATDDAVDDVQEMADRVEAGVDTVADTVETLETIVDHVESADDGVQSIADATDDQAASTEEVVAMVDQVGAVSEQTLARAQNAAAATEQQTASISEVTGNVQALSTRASNLRELVAQFEVGSGDAAAAGATAARVSAVDGDVATADAADDGTASGDATDEETAGDAPADAKSDNPDAGSDGEGGTQADRDADDGSDPDAADDGPTPGADDPTSPAVATRATDDLPGVDAADLSTPADGGSVADDAGDDGSRVAAVTERSAALLDRATGFAADPSGRLAGTREQVTGASQRARELTGRAVAWVPLPRGEQSSPGESLPDDADETPVSTDEVLADDEDSAPANADESQPLADDD